MSGSGKATGSGRGRWGTLLVLVAATGVLCGQAPAPASVAPTPFSLTAGMSYLRTAPAPSVASPGIDVHQAVSATEVLTGTQGWDFNIVNNTPDLAVADPAITVDSGWSPSLFPGLSRPTTACPTGVTREGTGFPYTWTYPAPLPGLPTTEYGCGYLAMDQVNESNQLGVADLSLGGGSGEPPLTSGLPASFQLGFDSFRQVDTTAVPPQGTQHLTVGVTVRDASYTRLVVDVATFMSPEVITFTTAPTDIPNCPPDPDPGTTCLVSQNAGSQEVNTQRAFWVINHPVPNTGYHFDLTCTNGGPIATNMVPEVTVRGIRHAASPAPVTGPSASLTVPSLDGDTPGSGTVAFSIGSDQDADWTVGTDDYVDLSYPGAGFGPTSKDDCKNGGWRNLTDALGRPFRNQGDCVSYVTTQGKNPAG